MSVSMQNYIPSVSSHVVDYIATSLLFLFVTEDSYIETLYKQC